MELSEIKERNENGNRFFLRQGEEGEACITYRNGKLRVTFPTDESRKRLSDLARRGLISIGHRLS